MKSLSLALLLIASLPAQAAVTSDQAPASPAARIYDPKDGMISKHIKSEHPQKVQDPYGAANPVNGAKPEPEKTAKPLGAG